MTIGVRLASERGAMTAGSRRWIWLSALVGALLAACGDGSSEPSGDDTSVGGNAIGGGPATGGVPTGGTGGSVAGTGGSVAGTGGSVAGTGGSVAGTGGSVAGTGGSVAGTGGSVAGTGGLVAGMGGSVAGSGGSVAGSGGSVAGTGGSVAGSGGSVAGSGGESAGTGGEGAGSGGVIGGAGGVEGTGGTSATGGDGGAGGAAGAPGTGGSAGYSPCPTTADTPCAILPLGDSITEGFGSSGGGYRVELFRQAVLGGRNVTFVGSAQNGPATVEGQTFPRQHEGHGGYTIDSDGSHSGISGSVTDQALDNYHPHIVLLMIGTNDINGNVDVANAPQRLGNLIDDITTRAPDALVVVASIIPIDNAGTNPRVQTYNAALPGLVDARAGAGQHVVFLDNYAAFAADPSYASTLMGDYLHPNDAGYALLGRTFYDALEAVLPTP